MKIALVNPPWSFEGSIYFGCREPHLPLEYGYARALLEADGHEVLLLDGQLDGWTLPAMSDALADFRPDVTVVTTAPSYLFWRCAPPELRVPQQTIEALRETPGALVAIGPHASTTPTTTVRKLGVDLAIMGEAEETLRQLARTPRADWPQLPHVAWREANGRVQTRGGIAQCDMSALPALRWADAIGPAPRAPPSPLRRGAGRTGRRDGDVARLPLPLHLLREGEFQERVPEAAARRDPGRARRAHRAGHRVRLLHRRDLPAEQGAAAGARRSGR